MDPSQSLDWLGFFEALHKGPLAYNRMRLCDSYALPMDVRSCRSTGSSTLDFYRTANRQKSPTAASVCHLSKIRGSTLPVSGRRDNLELIPTPVRGLVISFLHDAKQATKNSRIQSPIGNAIQTVNLVK